MTRFLLSFFLCVAVVPGFCQTESPKYEPGTILAVERHQPTDTERDSESVRYDVTVRIGDTDYVVLFTPVNASNTVEYTPGVQFLFSVGKDTLTLATPGKRDGNTERPILRTVKRPPEPALDWSKAPSQYFSMKMKNLVAELNLTEEQQAKIKPIAEQESGEAGGVIFTDVVPRKERLSQWEKIVRKSDSKMKPILTEAQWQKLQEIRKDQKSELTEIIAQRDKEEAK